jgi:ribonuclease E
MPVASAVDEPKAELKILPPEEPRRVEHNWESESFRNAASQPGSEPGRPTESRSAEQRPRRDDRRGDRPYFRSERERRDDRPLESREPRSDSAPMAQNSNTGRPQSESAPAPAPEQSKKSGGMFGWVKKLFGGTPAEAPKTEAQPSPSGQRDFNTDGPYRRRRRRGGRNRNFQGDQRGPREGQPGGQQGGGQPSGDQRGYGGDQRGYRDDQRGYRGGYRGDQRGYGGENRNQGNRQHGSGGFRGDGRPEGGPPPAGS